MKTSPAAFKKNKVQVGKISPDSVIFRHIQSRPFRDDEATELENIEMTKILEKIKKAKK
jgi:hypothetical protein